MDRTQRDRARHRRPRTDVTIGPGALADYRALARFHYRPGDPATIAGILAARRRGHLVGVLVVSYPTLNGRWRDRAWPGAFPRDKGLRAACINRSLRTISRVIVDPRARGLSVARSLVSAYLRRPFTRRTESLAAMGRFCPFFVAAGMREVALERAPRDVELAGALRDRGVRAWMLVDWEHGGKLLRRDPRLREAVRRWARGHKGLRRDLAGVALRRAALAAAAALTAPPRVYVSP